MSSHELRLARRRAVILATAVVVTLCSLIYAYFKASEVEKLKIKTKILNEELDSVKSSINKSL